MAVPLASSPFALRVVNSPNDFGSPRTPSARWTTKLLVADQLTVPEKLPRSRMNVRIWLADVPRLPRFSAFRLIVRMQDEPGEVPRMVVTPLRRALTAPYLIT